jgi:hypothetical protein
VLGKAHSGWLLAAVCAVGFILSPVLAGFAPLGGDPELMYQPIKVELARHLSAGVLPFWSDRFGLGVPLVAESHVAAFYPPNWFLYRFMSAGTGYRLALWLHIVALTAAMYAYARELGIQQVGSGLAAVSFALCGFQAVHAVHEPFYHVMPFVPLCLLFANCYVRTGRSAYVAAVALVWGTQITLGHFQIQMWTAVLVLMTGGYLTLVNGKGWHQKVSRILGLMLGLGWGAAIAWIQLSLTWELTGITGFVRPPKFLSNFPLPPAHWAQFALPAVFLGRPLGQGDAYWGRYGTTPGEACAYIGVVPFILGCTGMAGVERDRSLAVWRLLVPVTLAVATMPGWWPDGFFMLLQIPGLGWFRAPARYTLVTSLGLALLAGRALDLSVPPRRFWGGLAIAVVLGALAWAWSFYWAQRSDFQAGIGGDTLLPRFGAAGLVWALGLFAVFGWRRGRWGPWAVLALALLELGVLFYVGPVWWHWTIQLPEASSVLRHVAALPDVGLVAGRLLNLPVTANRSAAFPNLGITPPPPNYLLEPATLPPGENTDSERRWQRRFGVTHGVFGSADDIRGTEVLAEISDPVLDQVVGSTPALRTSGLGPWKLVRIPGAFAPAWVVLRVREAQSWGELYSELSRADAREDAWFLADDRPSNVLDPSAHSAQVESWDGRKAVVKHDGSCILILRRTYYPGWLYRVNDGPEQPVLKVDGGLQGVQLPGSGISHVVVNYYPTGLKRATAITAFAVGTALVVLGLAGLRGLPFRVRPYARSGPIP